VVAGYNLGMAKKNKVDVFPVSTRLGVVYGEEQFLKELKLKALKEALEGRHGEVQQFTFDGKTASLSDVLDEVRSYSLMQTYKLVVVNDADLFISGKRAGDESEGDGDEDEAGGSGSKREALMRYAQNPVDHATLIFRSNRWNKGKLDALIEAHGAIINCEAVSEATAVAWLQERAVEVHGRKIEPRAAGTLVARLGTDLMQLDTELEKLVTAAGKDQPVTPELVERMVGKSSEEEAWAVQEAYLRSLVDGPANAVEKLYEVITLSDQPKVLVSYFVVDLMRKLHMGAVMKSRGMGDFEIIQKVGFFGDRGPLLTAALRKLNPRKTAMMLDKAMELDMRSKTGFGDGTSNNEPPRGLECLAVALCEIARS
jgi:DNA polymerase III subunit delta